ncbi:sn-glycerol-3-phosphate ABC transporter ATP-binding protein UgpC [Candidatus Poribacteria bacterium]|nr:sn-glycerol-3-phosphate ABC transporter ATP-binding protein UgpC [Candidatus Poribacteria bacterium]
MATVRLVGVTKEYAGGVAAVCDASFQVQDQEFVVLVGPSGCGKSTTLRIIAGLEDATRGDVFIDERRVNDVPPKDRDIAMVFQNYALYPHMTCFQNMAFGLKLRRVPKAEIAERVREAAAILGIEHLLDRKPRALSGGERQRVAVGRAIVRHPKVFLFDEPLSNLDAKLRVQMRAEISKLHTRLAATMIYVTHDQTEAMTMGDRIVVMNEGVIQQMDGPLRLYASPANRFVAGFIGSPAMNFVEGELLQDGTHRQFRGKGLALPLAEPHAAMTAPRPDGPVVLGIRPEHVRVGDAGDSPAMPCRVEVVEPLGSETVVYLSAGETTLVAKAEAERTPTVGATVSARIDMARAHLFDPDSGTNLTASL